MFLLQVPLRVTMIDTILSTPSLLLTKTNQHFSSTFALGVSIMESFFKYQNALIMDRIPAYLQQYRYLVEQLCINANCDLNLKPDEIDALSDCAYMLEKFTNMLTQNRKHLLRVIPYLIADFLHFFEQFTLPSNIKVSPVFIVLSISNFNFSSFI